MRLTRVALCFTCDGAGRRSGVQRHVRLRRAVRRKAGHLLEFGHRHAVRPAFRRRRGNQQGLLGLNRIRGQVWGSDFLGHQLLFDLVDENEVVQLQTGSETGRSNSPSSSLPIDLS